ncbi:MAG: 50S ribosomal protein L4 [Candidatus Portnoybacteria bacterium RBG_13_40_8]|uniref:Large ribosomal subunit protein uL4 n=1 Tax=Candidatus Portnoybacteria bacterium RBG_13_40_8 TaxID=1801990 RepID=A0A1G2F561_9BACT|nr:MAG: 50S ribosomal protein L4 [Candidatus Portnoybacteria bacterium RBG_13_40_8]OGZ35560.1 MAG: 50S ribosomal protein L4 [Candidatus Portnoybacteria bacterium RIFCSPHIGHO2_01_FULL_39_19]
MIKHILNLPIYNLEGEKTGTIKLSEKIFGLKINNNLIYQVINVQLANKRKHLAKVKDRGEVRGGGRKPWRQKGTGRARHGSIRSPLWKGGGVTFGPNPGKIFNRKINKKAKRKAILMTLSSKANDKELIIMEDFKIKEAKTKVMANLINKILKEEKKPSILLTASQKDENLIKAIRNIPNTKIIPVNSLNVFDLLSFKYLFLDKEGIKIIEKTYASI